MKLARILFSPHASEFTVCEIRLKLIRVSARASRALILINFSFSQNGNKFA
nr:MAG TPA: hypothetical protein [Microviridae sp.]